MLQKLVGSMCDRAFKVFLKQGSFTGYQDELVVSFCNSSDMLKVALCVNSRQQTNYDQHLSYNILKYV